MNYVVDLFLLCMILLFS